MTLVDPLYEEFGKLMRAARESVGMSQAALGRLVQLSRTSITNIECGRQHVSLRQLFDMAEAVGRAPTSLLPQPRAALPRTIQSDIKRKGYGEEVTGLIEQVWASSAGVRTLDDGSNDQGIT